MKKRTHKLLSILLALVMVLGMLPVMSLTAFAEAAISNVTLTGVTEPIAGQVPTVDGISLGENVEITGDTFWIVYDEESGHYTDGVTEETPFEEGKKYALQIIAKPESGYEFSDGIEVSFNGSKLSNTESETNSFFGIFPEESEMAGRMLIMLYFDELVATPINSLTLTGVTVPTIGGTPTTAGISLGENVEITGDTFWIVYDEESGHYTDGVTEETPFEEGKKYALQIIAKPESGYEFSDGIEVSFNGSKLSNTESETNSFFGIFPEESEMAGRMLIMLFFEVDAHTHTYGTEWKSDADKHWHECSCGAKSEEAAHTLKWVVDKAATATEKGSKHEECEFCGYKRAAVEIPATGNTGSGSGGSGSSGSSSGGSTTPAKKPVQSVDTGDMGIALYAGMTILSLTGGAWVANKKRKGK